MKKLICLLPLALCGCLVIKHDAILPNGVHDSSSLRSFLAASSAAKVRTGSSFKGTNYTHSAAATDVESKGDTAFIEALSAGIAKGVLDALKASGGLPPVP
jgi:hypothetical protein